MVLVWRNEVYKFQFNYPLNKKLNNINIFIRLYCIWCSRTGMEKLQKVPIAPLDFICSQILDRSRAIKSVADKPESTVQN